jgi:ABC-type phosphate transport system auxiliary subunit
VGTAHLLILVFQLNLQVVGTVVPAHLAILLIMAALVDLAAAAEMEVILVQAEQVYQEKVIPAALVEMQMQELAEAAEALVGQVLQEKIMLVVQEELGYKHLQPSEIPILAQELQVQEEHIILPEVAVVE